MGEEIGLKIETGKSQAALEKTTVTVKSLKAEMKSLQSAALNGDGKAAARIGELRDQLQDLGDEVNTRTGSGVERLKNSFGQLGEGIMKMDFGQISTAFRGLGSAMKAIPIFLLIEGIKYLVENFDSLSKGTGPLAKVLRAVGDALKFVSDIIGSVINYFTDLAGATSDATRALEAQGKAIKETSDKVNAALQSQIKNFDDQIAIAKASGKSTVDLEIAKQQAIIDTNLTIARQIEAFVRAGGEFDDEKKKMLTASLEAIRGAKVTEQIIEINDHKAKQDNYKKHLEELRKIDSDDRDMKRKFQDDFLAESKKQDEDKAAKEAADADAAMNLELAMGMQSIETDGKVYAEKLKNRKDASDKETADHKKAIADRNQAEIYGLQAVQGLSDIFFTIKSAKLKKGSAEEEAMARKQFNINKALQIANAGMQGAQAVLSAFSSGAAIPIAGVFAGPAFATAAGIVAAANIAKIAAAQFGGSGGGGGDSAPSLPSTSINIPTINNPQNTPQPQGQTNLGANGENLTYNIRTHLSETEITSVTERVALLEGRAKL